jgi:murein DD-endopeptidase MepM/ murein hydrolase activator NlpD
LLKRLFKRDNSRPAIKKASELINSTSHVQKKYISLMLVPSYSTGRTRSLRVPRAVFHGVLAVVIAITLTITGLGLRNAYMEGVANRLDRELAETEYALDRLAMEAAETEQRLIDAAVEIYEQLTEEQIRYREEMRRQERRHIYALEDIWDYIDAIERMIEELEAEQEALLEHLGGRSDIIPPIVGLMGQLLSSRAELIDDQRSAILARNLERETYAVPAIGLLAATVERPVFADEMLQRVTDLVAELEFQQLLFDQMNTYREKMEGYLTNFPTHWPVSGQVSSGFGWRQNALGGRNFEHHNGVDIPKPQGTHTRAPGGGTVIFSGWRNGYGHTILIDHGGGIVTKYAHSTRNLVQVGDVVSRGDVIAHIGSTGRSTGPHLHFEVQVDGRAICPLPFMNSHFN